MIYRTVKTAQPPIKETPISKIEGCTGTITQTMQCLESTIPVLVLSTARRIGLMSTCPRNVRFWDSGRPRQDDAARGWLDAPEPVPESACRNRAGWLSFGTANRAGGEGMGGR